MLIKETPMSSPSSKLTSSKDSIEVIYDLWSDDYQIKKNVNSGVRTVLDLIYQEFVLYLEMLHSSLQTSLMEISSSLHYSIIIQKRIVFPTYKNSMASRLFQSLLVGWGAGSFLF